MSTGTHCLKSADDVVASAPEESGAAARTAANSEFCPACGHAWPVVPDNTRYQFDTARGLKSWSKCGRCRSFFMQEDYLAAAETDHTRQMAWGQHDAGTRLNEFKTDMFRSVLDSIQECGGHAGQTLLDVGCSFGGFLLQARQRGFVGSGLDIVPEAVDFVRSHGFAAQQCASLTECCLFSATDPVDVLTVLDAHIYWPDQPRELHAAHELLTPGGLLVMRAITKSPFITAGRLLQPVFPDSSRRLIRRAVTDHRFSMPLKSLLKTIDGCGFDIELASPRGAGHSAESTPMVRALFAAGTVSWHALRIAIAPGALIVARKRCP